MASNQTREFRAEAVRVAMTSGLPRKQVAADFGIGFSTLSRWIQQDRRNPEKPTAQSDLEREIAELRKENRLLREERDVLKRPRCSPLGHDTWSKERLNPRQVQQAPSFRPWRQVPDRGLLAEKRRNTTRSA